MALSLAPLPSHVRVTYTFFLVSETGQEMAIAVNDLSVNLDFSVEVSTSELVKLLNLDLAPNLFDGFRFMTEAETADYIERRNRGDIDDTEEP
ncbi:MAG: hypothetical protein DI537_36425 [Stutzerimonas stutzeri]|nr:MAG: hypothetical protein DI537_36425 [Stutzerimonas stutzeri]